MVQTVQRVTFSVTGRKSHTQSESRRVLIKPVGPSHILDVESVPSGISFLLDVTFISVTPSSNPLPGGEHTINMPPEVVLDTTTYYFKSWEDGSTNPVRTINLTADTTVTATYTTEKPPPPPPIPPWLILVIAGGILVAVAVAWRIK